MTLVIVVTLILLTAFVGFETGRRYQRGRKEIEAARRLDPREPTGRRGTMRLKPLKIRR